MKTECKALRLRLFEINCFAISMYLVFYIFYPLLNEGLYKLYRMIVANPMKINRFSDQYGDLVMIGLALVQIIGVLLYQRSKRIKFEPFNLKYSWNSKLLFFSFLCILSCNFLTDIISMGLGEVVKQAGYTVTPPETSLVKLGALGQIFSILYTILVGPIAEEVIYRGVIARQGIKISPIFGLVLSALIFSGMHANIDQTIATFLIGLFLGFIYYATGSLLFPICLHILNNLSVTLLEYWPIDQLLPQVSGIWAVLLQLLFYVFFVVLGCITLNQIVKYLTKDYKFTWSRRIKDSTIEQTMKGKGGSLVNYFLVYATLISTYLLFGLYWSDALAGLTPLK